MVTQSVGCVCYVVSINRLLSQRVFRGFRGKVFAQRWALKRAEIDALKSVLHEAAISVQSAYRGHLGRVEASEVICCYVGYTYSVLARPRRLRQLRRGSVNLELTTI